MTRPVDLLYFFRKNPVSAAKYLFGVDLKHAPFQRTILKSMWTHPFFIGIVSRGGGKSFLSGLFSSLRGILYAGEKVIITGPSFRQSKKVLETVELLHKTSAFFRNASDGEIKHLPDSYYLELKHGGVIKALPLGDGSKIRGERAHTLIGDEAAQLPGDIFNTAVMGMMATSKDPLRRVQQVKLLEKLKAAGKPLPSWKEGNINRMILMSSAWFKFNHLWKRIINYLKIANDKDRVNSHLYDVRVFDHTMLPPGFLDPSAVANAKETMSKMQFDMEYGCLWAEDSEGEYKRSLLESAESLQVKYELCNERDAWYILGIDPARTSANAAISIFKIMGRRVGLVNLITMNRKEFPVMVKRIRQVIKDYKNIKGVYMDADGGGRAIADYLAEEVEGEIRVLDMDNEIHKLLSGKKILRLIKANSQWNSSANFDLKGGLEQKRFLFPKTLIYTGSERENDLLEKAQGEIEQAKLEMQSIQVTHTDRSGVPHWDTPSKKQKKDRYSSILLGYKAFVDLVLKPQGIDDVTVDEELADGFLVDGPLVSVNGGNWFGDGGIIIGEN